MSTNSETPPPMNSRTPPPLNSETPPPMNSRTPPPMNGGNPPPGTFGNPPPGTFGNPSVIKSSSNVASSSNSSTVTSSSNSSSGFIGWEKRPQKFGVENRLHKMGSDYERSFRAINNSEGNPIYVGYAIVGADEKDPVWQIFKIEWGKNGGVEAILWPENNEGIASSGYQFIWKNLSTYKFV